MSDVFPLLFSPLDVGQVRLKNRVVFTGHHTHLAHTYVSDQLVAYLDARAEGGAGLIISEVSGIHKTARYAGDQLMVTDDSCVPGFARLADVVHKHGSKLIGQLFHPGREVLMSEDGTAVVAWAPSAIPGERRHVMPRAMPISMIREVIEGFGIGAKYMQDAGLDGVEIVASHGYLPAQFLNSEVNRRDDEYGGSTENRLRFIREIIESIQTSAPQLLIGLRISVDEQNPQGLEESDVIEACRSLDEDGMIDYFSVVLGSAASLSSSIHIVPPMEVEHAYVAPHAAAIKSVVRKPVLVTGRINQPQEAEKILASGQADLCGMTRAQIADPEFAIKAEQGRFDDIRACIGCNQACTGHSLGGYAISCIQHPESGRELVYGRLVATDAPRRVLVVGGGPAGMKAAAVAAARGHDVILAEQGRQLGGQARLAQSLPGRAEFGGIITNLSRECELAGVDIRKNTRVDAGWVRDNAIEAVVLATGAIPRIPEFEGQEDAQIVTAWEVINAEVKVGASVVIADWRCDWIGLGLAQLLAEQGRHVRLCVNGILPGESIQQYTRDSQIARLHRLGVEVITHARLIGVDCDTAYFQHVLSNEGIILENVDTLVLALGHQSVDGLECELRRVSCEVYMAGDCLAPRSCEEAVLEGLKAGVAV